MEPDSPTSESRDSLARPTVQTRREVVATIVIVVGALVATTVGTRAAGAHAPQRCDALFQRYVDLSLQQVDEKSKPWEREDKIVAARSKAEASEALRDCAANLTDLQADCADKATNPNELEQCFH